MPRLAAWKARAGELKVETYGLYLAYKRPEVPWYAKAFAACVVGYALSPIDLIPDFIPVLGYVDDLVIVPLGIAAARKMMPAPVLERCRAQAREDLSQKKPGSWLGVAIIIAIWFVVLAVVAVIGWRTFANE